MAARVQLDFPVRTGVHNWLNTDHIAQITWYPEEHEFIVKWTTGRSFKGLRPADRRRSHSMTKELGFRNGRTPVGYLSLVSHGGFRFIFA